MGLLLSKHVLVLNQDIFTLFHLDRPFKFVSKTSNFFIPIVGWSMFLTGALLTHNPSCSPVAQAARRGPYRVICQHAFQSSAAAGSHQCL